MGSFYKPLYAPIGSTYFAAVSVQSTASVQASATAQIGGFRALYINSSVTVGIVGIDGVSAQFQNPIIGQILWVAGDFVTFTGSAGVAGAVIGVR